MPTGTRTVLFLSLFTPNFNFQSGFAAKKNLKVPELEDLFSLMKSSMPSSKHS